LPLACGQQVGPACGADIFAKMNGAKKHKAIPLRRQKCTRIACVLSEEPDFSFDPPAA
jgi:hypothetical protein